VVDAFIAPIQADIDAFRITQQIRRWTFSAVLKPVTISMNEGWYVQTLGVRYVQRNVPFNYPAFQGQTQSVNALLVNTTIMSNRQAVLSGWPIRMLPLLCRGFVSVG